MIELAAVEYVDEEEPNVRPGWHVGNLSDADWALGRMAALQRQIAENDELMVAAVARIRARTAKLNEQLARGVTFFHSKLEEYAALHRDAILAGGKRKSRKLLHGTLAWRKTGGDFRVNDESALLAWAMEQPIELDFVRTIQKPAWSTIKAQLKTNGEVPPGVDVEPESEVFKIEALSMEGAANGDE